MKQLIFLTAHDQPEKSFVAISNIVKYSETMNSLGAFDRGADAEIIVKAPFIRPDEPIPATARAMNNIIEDVAIPHRREPSSKMKKKTIKVH